MEHPCIGNRNRTDDGSIDSSDGSAWCTLHWPVTTPLFCEDCRTVRFHLVAALPHCSFHVITLHWPPSAVKTLLFCENCICRHGTQRLPSSHRCLTTYFLPVIALSRSIRRCTDKPAPYSNRIFEAYAYLPNLHFAIHFPTTSVSSSFRMCEDFVR